MVKLLTILAFILALIIIAFIAYFLIKKFGVKKSISGIILFLIGIVLIFFTIGYKEWIQNTSTYLITLFSGIFLSVIGGILIALGITSKKNK